MELTFENYTLLKNEKLSRADIAARFGLPDWKLKKHIAANSWGKKSPVVSNTNAFDEYTPESCYWAGFLAADGNVDTKGRVRLMLKYDDISHLGKFREFMGSTHTIGSNTTEYNRCSFEFTSPYVCETLDLNFNIVPNKSLIYTFPKNIPDELLKHFIRGYFDGDGSICESFSNANSVTATLYATFCSGSYDFAKILYDKLSSILGLHGHLQDFNTGRKWQIKYNTNDAKKLLTYMYNNDVVSLDRKKLLYIRTVVDNNRMVR